jgi:translocation and assembly module TamA
MPADEDEAQQLLLDSDPNLTASLVLSAGQARGTGRTPGPLLRGLGRVTVYQPLPGGWYGQARVEAGEVFAKDSPASIDALGFRAGGDDSVRGYPYRSLGPIRDGAVAWIHGAEPGAGPWPEPNGRP